MEPWYDEIMINGLLHWQYRANGAIHLMDDYKVNPPLPQICFNHYCGKILGEDDHCDMFMTREQTFPIYWLCNECWDKFDGQKMRGRFSMMGFSHNESVSVLAAIERDCGKEIFSLGRPEDERRYTESLTEWVEWQKAIA